MKDAMNENKIREIVEGYVSVAEKLLNGQPLSSEERRLENAVDLVEKLVPGAFEEMLLEYAFSGESDRSDEPSDIEPPDAGQILAVAASSLEKESTLFDALQDAVRNKRETVTARLEDGREIEVLKILVKEEMVEPCLIEGKTVVVESGRIGTQEVTQYGGIFIPWEDLKKMSMHFEKDKIVFKM